MLITPFPIFLAVPIILWVTLEIWLVLRDLVKGRGKAGKDKGTRYYVSIAFYAGLTLAVFLSRNPRYFFPNRGSHIGLWIGMAIMMIGLALRIWAVAVLGASFRLTVETHKNQTVREDYQRYQKKTKKLIPWLW